MNVNKQIKGAVFDTAVFLMTMNDFTNHMEPMAYFPNTPWPKSSNKVSYMADDFAPCCEAFALLDCRPPKTPKEHKAVEALRSDLAEMGYFLTVLDAEQWVAEQKERRTSIRNTVLEATNVLETEANINHKRKGATSKGKAVA